MANVKLLISAPSGVGKTHCIKDLEDCFVISCDGKKFPHAIPHVLIPEVNDVDSFIETVYAKVAAYEEKLGKLPKVVVIDTLSKIIQDIESYYNATVSNFPYGVIGSEIRKLMKFIEVDLSDNFDVVMLSHSLYDEGTKSYKLVTAGGNTGKTGGAYASVDESLAIELKIGTTTKRIVHYRNPKLLARTLSDIEQDSVDMNDFNLQKHLELLRSKADSVNEWSL